jgi:2,3-bisphosphoglycerate-dependent phosphoglycerate mutase
VTTPADSTSVSQPTLDGALGDVCRVLLIRHGRSADIVPGTTESADPDLHPSGVEQARALAQRLSKMNLASVYSSHLRRAHRTAQHVAEHHGLEVVVHEDLEEVRLGDWSHGEFRRRAASGDPEFLAWYATGRWDGIPNAESDEEFRQRVIGRIDVLAANHIGETIAVVAHGGVINAYLAASLQTHRSLWMKVENTSITTVNVNNATKSVISLNDSHHLYDHLYYP